MKKSLLSFLTYNFFIQRLFYFIGIFQIRSIFRKTYNFFFKNLKINTSLLNYKISNKNGWSIIFLTHNLKKETIDKILEYKKNLINKKHELIIISNFNKSNHFDKRIRIINLNSNKLALGKKRNLGINISRFNKLIMSLDYFKIKKIDYKKLEKELVNNDLLVPKIKTKDNKRYLDWMFLDYPNIGKSFCPYNYKNRKYMYFHGSYFIFKKKYLIKNPFSNYLDHKQGEDVDWSLRVRNKIKFSLTDHVVPMIERFSYENEVLNDKNFVKNNQLIKKLNVK